MAVRVASFGKKFLCLCKIGIIVVIIKEIAILLFCNFRKLRVLCSITDTWAYKVHCRRISTLHYGVGNIVSVNSQRKCFSYLRVVKGSLLCIKGHIVSSHHGIHMEILFSGQVRNFLGRNCFGKKEFSLIICGICRIIIRNQMENNLVEGNICRIIVVVILFKGNMVTVYILRHFIGTAGNIGLRLSRPFVSIFFNGSFLYRRCGDERSNFIKISTGIT